MISSIRYNREGGYFVVGDGSDVLSHVVFALLSCLGFSPRMTHTLLGLQCSCLFNLETISLLLKV